MSDITYIHRAKWWAYLTIIIDLADRMVMAWNLSKELSSEQTTIKTLHIALERRKIDQPLLFHSDRGVQYAASTFRKGLKKHRYITRSMSRTGNCWENAVSESFFKTLKTERTNKHKYRSLEEAKKAIFDYIERWYNTQRVHSSIDYLSPLKKHYLLTNRTAA
ncbi:MAG: IS3 family transposase [Chlorobi bacterium]|nr:IS3 family transposase [Chlorobiota bacterium]